MATSASIGRHFHGFLEILIYMGIVIENQPGSAVIGIRRKIRMIILEFLEYDRMTSLASLFGHVFERNFSAAMLTVATGAIKRYLGIEPSVQVELEGHAGDERIVSPFFVFSFRDIHQSGRCHSMRHLPVFAENMTRQTLPAVIRVVFGEPGREQPTRGSAFEDGMAGVALLV